MTVSSLPECPRRTHTLSVPRGMIRDRAFPEPCNIAGNIAGTMRGPSRSDEEESDRSPAGRTGLHRLPDMRSCSPTRNRATATAIRPLSHRHRTPPRPDRYPQPRQSTRYSTRPSRARTRRIGPRRARTRAVQPRPNHPRCGLASSTCAGAHVAPRARTVSPRTVRNRLRVDAGFENRPRHER